MQVAPFSLQPLWVSKYATVIEALNSVNGFGDLVDKNIELKERFQQLLIASDFFADEVIRQPSVYVDLHISDNLNQNYASDAYTQSLAQLTNNVIDETQLHKVLRQFRRREMMRLVWRNALRLSDVVTLTQELSWLADSCLQVALSWLTNFYKASWGQPIVDGEPQQLIILGMGKLGGQELNLSSDIDLLFIYSGDGETVGGERHLSHQEYFTRLGQKLIQAISNRTEDGFVFRVDMRLRPYGQSGALVLSLAAMEEYYQDQGREWERYAMIKARVVAGDKTAGEQLLSTLKPFVYRKYIDFSVIDSLRDMKALITREIRNRKGDDVKVGEGGIREIEFIAQAFQLMRGGRDKHLQERHLLTMLKILGELNYLDAPIVNELTNAYIFLRNTEHALQAFNDQQTQKLPEDDISKARIAYVLGFENWSDFYSTLQSHRERVSFHFSQIISEQDKPSANAQEEKFASLWLADWDDGEVVEQITQTLSEVGFSQTSHVVDLLRALKNNRTVQSLQESVRLRLDTFMPKLLNVVSGVSNTTQTLERIIPLVESTLRRSAYLLLLNENHQALQQLVTLCAASPWIAEQLARAPILLDELIDADELYTPLNKKQLQQELHQQLLRLPEDDLEQQMEVLRYFKNAQALKIAACEIAHVVPLMKVSDYLTYLAEVILEEALSMAWRDLVAKYGVPEKSAGVACSPDFIIVAYGKLAGLELGHGSDLDLVFLFEADINLTTDSTERSIDNTLFFTRLAQRIIHLINTSTVSGIAYEIDTRLRPSGASGLLVTSLNAFKEYQLKQAWTWEHQALVRSRWVAGDVELGTKFEAVRIKVLTQDRDADKLKTDVMNMRVKMREHLATKVDEQAPVFDLKQDVGGIVDIEFMVQYTLLKWANRYPTLVQYSDNIRELEALATVGIFTSEDAQLLTQTYKTYRERAHQFALQKQPAIVSGNEFVALREQVHALWVKLVETTP